MQAPDRSPFPSLADLVNAAELGLACVSGHEWLGREVTWVHVAEINDPSPWLTRGVLLLTTGIVERTPAELDAFFAALRAHGVAGVGFGVGLAAADVPQTWMRSAAAHGIPLLRVPLDTPYIAISSFVSAHISDAQMNQVRRILDLQQRLALSSAIELHLEALGVLAAELGGSVVSRSTSGGLRTLGAPLPPGELHAVAGELTRHEASGRRSSSVSIGSRFVHVASTAGAPIAVVRSSRYTPLEQGMIGSIAVFIDLLRASSTAHSVSASFRERILGEAISGRLAHDPRLLELLLGAATRCTVVRLGPSPDPRVRSAKDPAAGLLLKAHLAESLSTADAPVAPLLCADAAEFIVVVPGADAAAVHDGVRSFLAVDSGNLSTWRAGVSRTAPAAHLLDLCGEAARAFGGTRERDTRVLTFDDLSRRDAWGGSLGSAPIAPIVSEWQRRLARSDAQQAAHTRAALRAFLAAHGAIERAAEELGVHRQTLRTRLGGAEQQLGLNLESPTDRALLWLALDSGSLEPESPAPGAR